MSIIFPVTNMQVSENTALLIKENTTLYIDALNENAVITLPEPTENPNLFLNIINTSILHQLVILDVITLNPNSGVSLKCDGKKWIYETLNSESLYILSLSNGMSGSEVHNLTQIFNTTNNINNLSESYKSFLNSNLNDSITIPILDYSNAKEIDIFSSLTQDSNYDIYNYTTTIDGLIIINLATSLNGGIFQIYDLDTNYNYYASSGRNGMNAFSFIITKNTNLVIRCSKDKSTSCVIIEIPFKTISSENNNSCNCIPNYEKATSTSLSLYQEDDYCLNDGRKLIDIYSCVKYVPNQDEYLTVLANDSRSGFVDNYIYVLYYINGNKTNPYPLIYHRFGYIGGMTTPFLVKKDVVYFICCDKSATSFTAYSIPLVKSTNTSDTLLYSNVYSSAETQVGIYEDGRPVYRRIFRGPGLSAGSTSMIVPGSDELANVVDIVLRLDGIYHWSSAGNYYPINFLRKDTEYSRINYNSNSGIILNLTISNWVDAEYTIIFEYVKK